MMRHIISATSLQGGAHLAMCGHVFDSYDAAVAEGHPVGNYLSATHTASLSAAHRAGIDCETCIVRHRVATGSPSLPDLRRGDPVTVSWRGTVRYGVVTGDVYRDSLPTGASFVPVFFDDDGTDHNVDTRVVVLGCHRL